jgi:1-acyl-sn-glycerol-3-phosphate acyltransferase
LPYQDNQLLPQGTGEVSACGLINARTTFRMILRAKHNFFLYNFFKGYIWWKIRSVFDSVHITGNYDQTGKPVLLLANHISWWDGFWAMYLNMKIIRKKFYFMMLEKELRKHWFFNYTGGFSVRKKSRSIIETLQYAGELLSDSNNMVLVFPHGRLQSMHQQNFRFEKGIERIIQNRQDRLHILFMVTLVDYFSKPKPSVYIYINKYESEKTTIEEIQNSYNEFYRRCIEKQINDPLT